MSCYLCNYNIETARGNFCLDCSRTFNITMTRTDAKKIFKLNNTELNKLDCYEYEGFYGTISIYKTFDLANCALKIYNNNNKYLIKIKKFIQDHLIFNHLLKLIQEFQNTFGDKNNYNIYKKMQIKILELYHSFRSNQNLDLNIFTEFFENLKFSAIQDIEIINRNMANCENYIMNHIQLSEKEKKLVINSVHFIKYRNECQEKINPKYTQELDTIAETILKSIIRHQIIEQCKIYIDNLSLLKLIKKKIFTSNIYENIINCKFFINLGNRGTIDMCFKEIDILAESLIKEHANNLLLKKNKKIEKLKNNNHSVSKV